MSPLQILSKDILSEFTDENKLVLNEKMLDEVQKLLQKSPMIESLDSTTLLKEVISDDKKVQIITWALQFQDQWEYYGFLKSYNESKKTFVVMDLVPAPLENTSIKKETFTQNNWPAGVYYKIIENEHNNKTIYTLFGWIANSGETAHKFLDVMILNRNGEPGFSKAGIFNYQGNQLGRIVFSYHFQSRFLLDYGVYEYSEKTWNSRKKRYDIQDFKGSLIVFDELIPMYPDLADYKDFMVPSGHKINAFMFEKGKWKFKEDVDARNRKQKEKKRSVPGLELIKPNE